MNRTDKINHEIQRALSSIIREELDDPNLGMLSVVRVQTSPDMRNCTVYFSVFPEENAADATNALSRLSKHFRHELARSVKLKYIPELRFKSDDSIKYSIDINNTIEEIKDELG